MTDRQLTILAAINLLIAVGAGAFGAHGLKRLVTPELLSVWQTGVLYHLIHGLGPVSYTHLRWPRWRWRPRWSASTTPAGAPAW